MSGQLTAAAALKRVVGEALQPRLVAAGFAPGKRPRSWVRTLPELNHVVALDKTRQHHTLRWGVWVSGASEIVWGETAEPSEVAYAVVGGTATSIRHPAPLGSFKLAERSESSDLDPMVAALAAEVELIDSTLSLYRDRRSTWQRLLIERPRAARPEFDFPAAQPLKLLTAAAVAALDRDPEACRLAAAAVTALSSFTDDINTARLSRLDAAVRGLCD